MTRPLRRAHLRIWITLAVLLPVLLVTAVAARRTTTPRNSDMVWERIR
jgi:hypothetical protein